MVLIASFCTQLLCDGTVSAYGVVYAGLANDTYFKKANYTEEKLALPGAIQSCLYVTASKLEKIALSYQLDVSTSMRNILKRKMDVIRLQLSPQQTSKCSEKDKASEQS